MAERRVFLVGEHNPHGADPRLALHPRPPNGAGGRLRRLLGMSEREYLRTFERRNLLSELPWRAADARRAARRVLAETARGDRLVLLGAKVAAAFGVAFRTNIYLPRFVQLSWPPNFVGRTVLVLPHPSGRCRVYNDAEAVRLARAAVTELLVDPLESIGAEP